MSVLTRKDRPLRLVPSTSPALRHSRKRRYAEAPDRGELDPRQQEACFRPQSEAPDAGEAIQDEESTRGRSQS